MPVLNAFVSPPRAPMTRCTNAITPVGELYRPPYMNVGLPTSRLQTIGWRHPDKRITNASRVLFSSLELNYIGEWSRNDDLAFAEARAFRETLGNNRVKRCTDISILSYSLTLMYNRIIRCLDGIREDNFARSIFHQKHIFKSDRLKNGFITYNKCKHIYTHEKYEKEKEEIMQQFPESSYPVTGINFENEIDDNGDRYA